MAYTTINKSTDYFNTKLYTGNNTNAQSITGVGFQPDMTWIKIRNDTRKHNIYDAVRGVTKRLVPNDTPAEDTVNGVTAFNTDGFSVGNETDCNQGSNTFVSWNWKAETAFSNSAGANGATIASSGRVNTTAGCSIVSFVGNSTSGATVAHGLGAIPKVVIIKSRDTAYSWRSYFAPIGATKYIELDSGAAAVTASNFMNNTAPTSTLFSLGNGDTPNKNGDNYIAYCFAEKTGYSKIGQYKSTGYSDGPFCYTGFTPKYVLIKNYSDSAEWEIYDTKRAGYNPANYHLNAQDTSAEATLSGRLDFLSNGFKIKVTNSGPLNSGTAGQTYFFMAFAEAPLVGSNNVPCTAR